MDVDIAIRYSDDRLCTVTVCRPADDGVIYRIVGRRESLSGSLAEAIREARRLYETGPWPRRQ
jgi:hypothetical protein